MSAAARPRLGVALDVHALQVEGWADRGVGRYVSGYAAALARRGVLAAALLAPELPPASGVPNELAAAGLVGWDSAAACRSLIGSTAGLVYQVTAPFLHFEPDAPAGLGVVEHWARSGVPRVVLLHDLIPLRAPRHYLHSAGHEDSYRARAGWAGAADLVLTNSDYTRREAIALLGCDPDRVVTVGAGVSSYFAPADGTDDELWRVTFPRLAGRPFVLTVGGSDARKGTERAIAALGLLAARGYDLDLLIVGHLTPAWRSELGEAARACGVAGRVCFGGAVDDELLRAAYRRAVVTIMPSLAEGAGLPVLESAACATPALASAGTALAETAASPAALFDPTDVDSIAGAIGAAADSAGRRAAILAVQQRRASESTWDAVAGRSVEAISALVGGRPPGATRMGPPRLALVGWPPGHDDQLADLKAAWSDGPGSVGPGSVGPGSVETVWVVDPAAAGPEVRLASFEQVVYVLTGTPADGAVLPVAGRFPGWLWLWGPAGGWLEPLVRRSRGILVGSATAAGELGMSLRPRAAVPPVVVVDGAAALVDALGSDPAASV